MRSFGWTRVAILHDDSQWGIECGGALADSLGEGVAILNSGRTVIPMAAFPRGGAGRLARHAAAAAAALNALNAVEARVVLLAVHPHIQRAIFAESFRGGLLRGEGYAWISLWAAQGAFLAADDNEEDAVVAADAVRGAEGVIGILAGRDTTTAEFNAYMRRWVASSGPSGCTGAPLATSAPLFCDATGRKRGHPQQQGGETRTAAPLYEYSHQMVDAVLSFATAMDGLPVPTHKLTHTPRSQTIILYSILKMGSVL